MDAVSYRRSLVTLCNIRYTAPPYIGPNVYSVPLLCVYSVTVYHYSMSTVQRYGAAISWQ